MSTKALLKENVNSIIQHHKVSLNNAFVVVQLLTVLRLYFLPFREIIHMRVCICICAGIYR